MNTMSPEKIELCLKVLSAVAWADSELSVDEIARAVDLLEPMDYADRHRIEEIFMMPHHLPAQAKLEILSPNERSQLMLNAHSVAMEFNGMSPHEAELLQILHVFLGSEEQLQHASFKGGA